MQRAKRHARHSKCPGFQYKAYYTHHKHFIPHQLSTTLTHTVVTESLDYSKEYFCRVNFVSEKNKIKERFELRFQ